MLLESLKKLPHFAAYESKFHQLFANYANNGKDLYCHENENSQEYNKRIPLFVKRIMPVFENVSTAEDAYKILIFLYHFEIKNAGSNYGNKARSNELSEHLLNNHVQFCKLSIHFLTDEKTLEELVLLDFKWLFQRSTTLNRLGTRNFINLSRLEKIFDAINKHNFTTITLLDEAKQGLDNYAASCLKEVSPGEIKANGLLVPNSRAEAFLELRTSLKSEDFTWQAFITLIETPEFRIKAGYFDKGKAAPRYSLWPLVASIVRAFQEQERFFMQFKSSNYLELIIGDDECFKSLNPHYFAMILIYCDRDLFVKLLTKYERMDSWQPFTDLATGKLLDKNTLLAIRQEQDEKQIEALPKITFEVEFSNPIKPDELTPESLCSMGNNLIGFVQLFQGFRQYYSASDNKRFTEILENISKTNLNSVSCLNKSKAEAEKILAVCTKQLREAFNEFLDFLNRNYKDGDISLDGFTVRARLTLCYALNIKLTHTYFSGDYALKIDGLIKNLLVKVKPPYAFDPQSNLRCLPDIQAAKELPVLYGKRLTPKLLHQLAANWLKFYDDKLVTGRELPSIALKKLFDILNQMETELQDELKDHKPLLTSFCTRTFPMLFNDPDVRLERQKDKTVDMFLMTLESSINFTLYDPQPVDKKKQIKFSDLANKLDLYTRKQTFFTDHNASYFTKMKEIAPFIPDEEKDEKEVGHHFQRGVFKQLFGRKSDWINKLENVLAQIRNHHQEFVNDFPLDKFDLALLKNLLAERWAELCALSEHPDNYREFPKATDKIYQSIALLVKNGLKNFEPNAEITAYQLLMPGRIAQGVYGMNDVDEFKYEHIIALPQGKWVYVPYLLDRYKNNGQLVNIISSGGETIATQALTENETQHIVKYYPDIAQTLLQHFTERYCETGFDGKVKEAFIAYLKESVFREGYVSFYYGDHDTRSKLASDRLAVFLDTLPIQQRDILLNMKIPESSYTLARTLNNEVTSCITMAGFYIAKLVWHNCPDVKIEELGEHPESYRNAIIGVPRKPNSKNDWGNISLNEKPLYELYAAKHLPFYKQNQKELAKLKSRQA
ncbi:MAG: hypothetical protein ABI597_07860 [Gammaproteobacteria bacterium]